MKPIAELRALLDELESRHVRLSARIDKGEVLGVGSEIEGLAAGLRDLDGKLLEVRRELAAITLEDLKTGILDHLSLHRTGGVQDGEAVGYLERTAEVAITEVEGSLGPISILNAQREEWSEYLMTLGHSGLPFESDDS